ncbi:MAG: DnaJ domain-containing protein [Candidatus Dormibacteria bacterium]
MRASARSAVDVYHLLGAERTDSWPELRRRYRARARELHPDVQVHRQGPQRLDLKRANALFSQLQAAWSLVATPERRAAYDLAVRGLPPAKDVPLRKPVKAPAWSAGPAAAVLLRSGPGDLHIAIPGGSWDLSLAQFAKGVAAGSLPKLLIGDLPPHSELRLALRGLEFVERHRLTTMVGLVEPAEEREPEPARGEDDGAWKLAQLERALAAWGRAMPTRRKQLPYGADLLLMGRLSLAGYELNLPHPAGLFAAVEARPLTRSQAQERRSQALLDLRIPAPTLLLAACWSQDAQLISDLTTGALDAGSSGPGSWQRALAAKRPRTDHHEPLWGSALDRPEQIPEGLAQLCRYRDAWEWLGAPGRCPQSLPWGEPTSDCGRDRRLSDAGARLVSHLLAALLEQLPEGTALAALRGPTLRLRTDQQQVAELSARLRELVPALLQRDLGFAVPVTVG